MLNRQVKNVWRVQVLISSNLAGSKRSQKAGWPKELAP